LLDFFNQLVFQKVLVPMEAQGKGKIKWFPTKGQGGTDQYFQYCKISSRLKHFPPGNNWQNLIRFILKQLAEGPKEK
jgi:hypothetical protein